MKNHHQIADALRSRCKAAGLTQSALAKLLGISIPTAKRWLKGEGLDLISLQRLLSAIGMTWQEFAAHIDLDSPPRFQYSLRQEEILAEDPQLLLVFDALLRGMNTKSVQDHFQISYATLRRFLRQLEDVQLLEVHERDRIKLRKHGEPVWRENGPLARMFRSLLLAGFCKKFGDDRKHLRIALHHYRPEDVATLQRKIADLMDFATLADQRSLRSSNFIAATEYTLVTGLAPFALRDAVVTQSLG
jgi:transcriptional regulator with XRE-family HTH domain